MERKARRDLLVIMPPINGTLLDEYAQKPPFEMASVIKSKYIMSSKVHSGMLGTVNHLICPDTKETKRR